MNRLAVIAVAVFIAFTLVDNGMDFKARTMGSQYAVLEAINEP